MRRIVLLPACYLLDQIAGDPEWFPHPVRGIGLAVQGGERALRRPGQSSAEEFLRGAALAAGLVGLTWAAAAGAIRWAYGVSESAGCACELVLGWTCLAARNLDREAAAVREALAGGDLALARRRLSRIVGRDTQELDEGEICRAVIETLAESASDGVIAPLLYMAIGGVPLAMAYKAVNTLDSMIGHADARYFYFGKFAARLDDAANYLPARLTAAGIVLAAGATRAGDARAAWRTWQRDGGRHKSPNAGRPESAMAGALRVRLGGGNSYGGEWLPAPALGEQFAPPGQQDAARAARLVASVALLGAAFGLLLGAFFRPGRSR